LASNSLLEGLVFGERTVRDLNRYLAVSDPAVRKIRLDLAEEPREGNDAAVLEERRAAMSRLMMDLCGIVRGSEGLEQARAALGGIRRSLNAPGLTVAELELLNLLTVAEHMVGSAIVREESRGVHLRSDFPELDDGRWRRHITVRRDPVTGGPVVESSAMEG
jgi:L-aspartate oxidase